MAGSPKAVSIVSSTRPVPDGAAMHINIVISVEALLLIALLLGVFGRG